MASFKKEGSCKRDIQHSAPGETKRAGERVRGEVRQVFLRGRKCNDHQKRFLILCQCCL